MIATLLAIGDSVSLRYNFVEQATAVTGYADTISGLTPSRTVDRDFYWSLDGTTWTGPISQASLQALSFDKDDPLYLRVDWTRTGTDGSGLVVIHEADFAFSYDPNGLTGHGQLLEENVYEDFSSILQQVINQITPSYDGRPHFVFSWGPGEKCTPDSTRPTVFAHDMKVSDRHRNSDHRQRTITVRMGIRRKCIQQHQFFDRMRGLIKQRLGERAQDFTYDINLRGVQFLGIRLAKLGIWGIRSYADAEITGGTQSNDELKCGCTWWETQLEFQLLVNFASTVTV